MCHVNWIVGNWSQVISVLYCDSESSSKLKCGCKCAKQHFVTLKCNKEKCTADSHSLHEPLYCLTGHNPQRLCLQEQFTLIYSSFIIASLVVGCREFYKLNVCAGTSLCAQEGSQSKVWVIQAVIWSGLGMVSLAWVAKTFLDCTLPHSPQYCLSKLPQHWPGELLSRYMHTPQPFRTEAWLWYLLCQASIRPEYRNRITGEE